MYRIMVKISYFICTFSNSNTFLALYDPILFREDNKYSIQFNSNSIKNSIQQNLCYSVPYAGKPCLLAAINLRNLLTWELLDDHKKLTDNTASKCLKKINGKEKTLCLITNFTTFLQYQLSNKHNNFIFVLITRGLFPL